MSYLAEEAAIHLNVIEGISFPLGPHSVSWCLGGLLSSHVEFSVVDMVFTGCFVFKEWEKLFF